MGGIIRGKRRKEKVNQRMKNTEGGKQTCQLGELLRIRKGFKGRTKKKGRNAESKSDLIIKLIQRVEKLAKIKKNRKGSLRTSNEESNN